MGDIYVVKGPRSCGKTSTIKEIFRILNKKYPNCIKEVYLPLNARACWKIKQYGAMIKMIFSEPKDIRIEMQNVKSLLVGIESQGDPEYERLIKSLEIFSSNKCDIIFCAERIDPNREIVANWVKSHNKRNPHNKYKIKKIFTLQKVVGTKEQRDIVNHKNAQVIVKAAGL